MERITSSKNQIIKKTKKLLTVKYREKTGLMILEGTRLVETALQSGAVVEYILINQQVLESQWWSTLDGYLKTSNIEFYLVSDNLMKEMSSTDSPQGVLAVAKKPIADLVKIDLIPNPLILILDQVRDPGNLGTIIRSADAAGCSYILCAKGTVDFSNPKALRSSMGSAFHLPIVPVEDLKEKIIELKNKGIQVVAADSKGSSYYYDLDLKKPTAIILGNEAEGICPENLALADRIAKIPIWGKAESLNVAIAASLFIYEAVRQRQV